LEKKLLVALAGPHFDPFLEGESNLEQVNFQANCKIKMTELINVLKFNQLDGF